MRNQRGFTLVEIVVTLVVMSVMGLFSVQYLSEIARMNKKVVAQKNLVTGAKIAMEFMTREMRTAQNTPTCGSTPVTCVTSTAYDGITFDKYIVTSESPLRKDTNASAVKYYLSGTTLYRTSNAITTTVATNVTGFTVTPTSTNFYRFILTMTGSDGENFSLESSVKPRNITG
jgi:prepilin-type N-terminal cleavage/methylation domain-containing protein